MEDQMALRPEPRLMAEIRFRLAPWLTLETLWLITVPLGLLCIQSLSVVPPNDFWWHVRTGQIIVETGTIPTVDAFSFTQAGAAWINQAWLMQVALYLLYTAGGLPLVIFLHAVVIAAGYTLVLRHVIRHYGLRIGAAATMLGAAIGGSSTAVRPQSISFLFFGLLIWLIESHRQGQTRRLWLAVPLFVLWVNSHGAFVFGLAALGFYVVGRLWEFWRDGLPAEQNSEMRQLALIGIMSLLALSLNPQGPMGIVEYVLGFFQSEATVEFNVEFAPLVIRDIGGMLVFGSLLLLVVAIIQSGVRPRPDQVINVLAFAALTLWAMRSAAWFGFVLIPILAASVRAWLDRPRPASQGRLWLNGIILVGFVAAFIFSLPWFRSWTPIPLLSERRVFATVKTPIAATEFLCETAPEDARVFQEQGFASYQIWACPRLPVFVDTRVELYPFEQWKDYLALEVGVFDWQEIAADYGLTHLFLSVEQNRLIDAATAAENWHEIYRDDRAVIFARTTP